MALSWLPWTERNTKKRNVTHFPSGMDLTRLREQDAPRIDAPERPLNCVTIVTCPAVPDSHSTSGLAAIAGRVRRLKVINRGNSKWSRSFRFDRDHPVKSTWWNRIAHILGRVLVLLITLISFRWALRMLHTSRRRFTDWAAFIWELESTLKSHGIEVPPGSSFEDAALTLVEFDEVAAGRAVHDSKTDHREKWRRALSLADFAEKIVLVRGHADFAQLIPHLRLLAEDFDLSQFSFTAKENQENNKVFELYVAAMAMHLMKDCAVDSPTNSKGNNPDILGEYSGKRWAIACKAMHTKSAKTFLERVKEGVDQIERSDAKRGIVVMNMKNTVDHDALWPSWQDANGDWYYAAHFTLAGARARILAEFKHLQDELFAECGSEPAFYRLVFSGKKASPHVLLIYSTASGFQEPSGPVFTMLKTMQGLYGPREDRETERLARKLNNCLHNAPRLPAVKATEIG